MVSIQGEFFSESTKGCRREACYWLGPQVSIARSLLRRWNLSSLGPAIRCAWLRDRRNGNRAESIFSIRREYQGQLVINRRRLPHGNGRGYPCCDTNS